MPTTTAAPGNANRYLAGLFGVLWLVGGVLALVSSRRAGFFDADGVTLFGQFDLNGFRATLMVVVGAALTVAATTRPGWTRRANVTAGLTWLVLDLFALLVGHRSLNVLALHDKDADLLLVAALALLAAGLMLDAPATTGHGPTYRSVRYGQGPPNLLAADRAAEERRAG